VGALSKGKAKVKTFRREVIGKPNDRKGHVRFDEGMVETQFGCAPLFYSTKWDYTDFHQRRIRLRRKNAPACRRGRDYTD